MLAIILVVIARSVSSEAIHRATSAADVSMDCFVSAVLAMTMKINQFAGRKPVEIHGMAATSTRPTSRASM